ncbi:nonribosomal peptide synthetase MxaA [Methylobacterium sp. NEAU K]|uniref:nonribosomal peptide synthetase MxaA n=1 Tax=Methylobacterium sp. NEAU K TaxID=3064946 RepID=UPI002733015E|nr:nonribosomal peptide synthetase MxaA [Methylobacterium sp. NEAU K]MDP4002100.1 nonribosomal peptide synthetase MxaA [Methylobacterium sp. NEAU K]
MRTRALPPSLALLFLSAGLADAQLRSVEVRSPRPFGVFLGDLVEAQVDILADPGFSLQRASLPQPGPVTYWLDLRTIALDETASGAVRRVRLRLTYQAFYAALDARTLEVPGFAVTLASPSAGGVSTATVQVPGWSLGVSPLREVQPQRREDPAEYLRPDGRGERIASRPLFAGAAGLGALAIVAALATAHDRAWGPFRRRRGRPFAAALRALRRQRAPDPDQAYRGALLALHRGLDQADGRRVLAEDLGAFLDRHAAFREQAAGLRRFFEASRLAFFGGRIAEARATWPRAEAEAVLTRLAAAERRA